MNELEVRAKKSSVIEWIALALDGMTNGTRNLSPELKKRLFALPVAKLEELLADVKRTPDFNRANLTLLGAASDFEREQRDRDRPEGEAEMDF